MQNNIKIFAGQPSVIFAEKICKELGVSLGKALIGEFSDGERRIEIQENVRNRHVFIIHNTGPGPGYVLDLILLMDALRRSSVDKITVVIPYYGFARQERKDRPHVPISARAIADCIESQLPTRLIFCDLHSAAIPGFFKTTSDHIYARPVFLNHIRTKFADQLEKLVLVAPDVGAAKMTRSYAQRLQVPIAIIDKRRAEPNQMKVMNIIGDVTGRVCLLLDDLVDTAGTITAGAEALLKVGAIEVHAMATHGVLSGPAIERIQKSSLISLMISDTIDLKEEAKNCNKIEIVSLAGIFAQAIDRTFSGDSLSALFD